ncbi:hypothetical protein Tco_0580584 [Tanacetum coccineum]
MNMLNFGMIGKKCEECKHDKISYDKAYNNVQHQIERLQAQLEDLKDKSMDTQCASDNLDPLSQKLEDENVPLKVVESNDLSNPVTSNSVPNTKESKVVKNNTMIAIGMLSINPSKTSREDKIMPLNKARAMMRDENPIRTLGDYSRPSHEGYRNTIELPEGNNVVPLRSDTIRLVQNRCSFHGLWSEDPNQNLKDFLKLVDSLDLDVANRERTRLRLFQFSLRDQASNWLERLPAGSISTWEDLTTYVSSTSDCRLVDFENQVQRLMEAYLAPKQPVQVNKITSSYEICSGPHDTQYCMENLEQAFIDYTSSRTDKAGGKWISVQLHGTDARLSKFKAGFKQQQGEMTNKINTILKAITDRITGALPSDTVKNPKLNVNPTSPVFSSRSYLMEDPQCSSHPLNSMNAIKTCSKETNHSQKDQLQTVMEIETQPSEEPEQTLEDEF